MAGGSFALVEQQKKKIGIVGATGFTGLELVERLSKHPLVELVALTSVSHAGQLFSEVHPRFKRQLDLPLLTVEDLSNLSLDLVFLAVPHGVGMKLVEQWEGVSFRIIDLSADFRLELEADYEKWYRQKHSYAKGLEKAVYGLPELFEKDIASAQLVANPGCQPTCALLALAPLLAANVDIYPSIIIDAKSGASGAGARLRKATQFMNIHNNVTVRSLKKHRHSIEIESYLNKLSENPVIVQFTVHLLPIDRGILTTIYVQAKKPIDSTNLLKLYQQYYQNKPFVEVVTHSPALKTVQFSNNCVIYPTYDERTGNIILISVIDNLVKGAAGQAIQNMNLMMGWTETMGFHF